MIEGYNEEEMKKSQDSVMERYKNLGFVKDKKDEEGLHMFHSPYRVPKGLTKLQCRRRINTYNSGKKKPDLYILTANRLDLTINGKFMLGTTFKGKVPENPRQLKKLIKKLWQTGM